MRSAMGLAAIGLLVGATAATAGPRLAPNEIQATFFTGVPFTATSTSGSTKFKMIFTTDGKASREPVGRSGEKNEGTWTLSKEGYCTTWKGGKQNCFVVITTSDNKWQVMRGTTAIAIWTKQ